MTWLISSTLQSATKILLNSTNITSSCVRNASKKASASTRIKPGHPRPKHRGWRKQDGHVVTAGTMLATQRTTRFHPGQYVGFGKDGTLFAMEPGKVAVTCEKINPNWDHTWIQGNYTGREGHVIYKKHFNIIPEPQHNRFKLVSTI